MAKTKKNQTKQTQKTTGNVHANVQPSVAVLYEVLFGERELKREPINDSKTVRVAYRPKAKPRRRSAATRKRPDPTAIWPPFRPARKFRCPTCCRRPGNHQKEIRETSRKTCRSQITKAKVDGPLQRNQFQVRPKSAAVISRVHTNTAVNTRKNSLNSLKLG